MDVGLPVSVVVQQHLGSTGSILVDLLRRRAGVEAEWAHDSGRLQPGRVLVAPPRRRLEFFPDGSYELKDIETGIRSLPHDAMLTSLADSFGAGVLAVILTGMGRDGAAGVTAVQAANGVVIAQSEDTAEQPSMPRFAAEAGADLVLPLHEIARVLTDVVAGQELPRPEGEQAALRATFGEAGEIARLAREIDWLTTTLGPVRFWPDAQRMAVRQAMDAPHGITLFLGPDHIIIQNDVGLVSMGGVQAQKLGLSFAQAYPEALAYMQPVLATVMAGGRVYHEATLVPFDKQGRIEHAWFDMSYTPIRTVDGSILGVQQTFLDRTEEVLNRRRLQTLNRLAAVAGARSRAEALVAATEVLDAAEDVPFAMAYLIEPARAQASLAAVCGVEPGGSIAPHRLRLTPGTVWPLHRVLGERTEIVLDDMTDRFRGHRVGDGQVVPREAVLYPLTGHADGDISGVLVLGAHPGTPLDVAYRAFLTLVGESVAAKAQEGHARHQEQQRLTQLAELDRAKTEFFSNVSHEFRTPLTLMLSPLEDLMQEAGDPVAAPRAVIDVVQRNAQRLLRLVNTMLDFSQIEAGRMRAQLVPTDLSSLTQEVSSMFRSTVENAGLELRVDTGPLPHPVQVDPEMWEKIVSNLLSNAFKFTWTGSIEITLRALPKHVELTVRDTGVGIAADQLPHLFKRFHRVHGIRGRTHEGAGIGLALVNELIRRHHGRVRLTSELEVGTTVTVWIPLNRRPVPGAVVPAAREPGRLAAAMAEEALRWGEATDLVPVPDDREPAAPIPGARLLVVDDNPDMRKYLVRLLQSRWRVASAGDGSQALEQARRNPPDLVLTDTMMPGTDGFSLLREIRADPRLAAVPVVLVTARAGEQAAVEGLLAGADDYVVKPFSARELVARIAAQLELSAMRRRLVAADTYRLALTHALQDLSDPDVMQQRAIEILAEELGVTNVHYCEVNSDAGTLAVLAEHRQAGPSYLGTYRLDEWGGAFLGQTLGRGRSLVIDDVRGCDLDDVGRAAWESAGVRAVVKVPLSREGRWIGHLAALQDRPRRWTPQEVALVEETAARTWAFIERTRAEAQLRRFAALVEASDELIGICDHDLVPLYTNAAALAHIGLEDAGDPRLRTMLDVVHPDDLVQAQELFATARRDGHAESELRLRRFDTQEIRWVIYSVTLLPGKAEKPGGFAILARDVTERRHAEAAVQDSERRMRLATAATGMVTWEWLPGEDSITTSENFASVYGLPELAGVDAGFALVLPEDHAAHQANVQRIAAEGGRYLSQFRIRRPDGRIVWLEERAEATLAPDGTVGRILGVTLDVTDRMT
ncbi:chemotaxis protein CheB [Kineosporia corallincola]|nr:chemotaxis protein CheB [Kineosporia corallincola]